MAKISFVLVFSLVLVLPLRSVLGQDWSSVLNQATSVGISQETLDQASQAIGGGSAEQVFGDAKNAIRDAGGDAAALGDMVKNHVEGASSSPANAPTEADAPAADDDSDGFDEDDMPGAKDYSPAGAPHGSPAGAPHGSPAGAPHGSPAGAPHGSPAAAPGDFEQSPRGAPYYSPPAEAPTDAPQAYAPGAPTPTS